MGGGREARPSDRQEASPLGPWARVAASGWDGPCWGPGLGQTACSTGRGGAWLPRSPRGQRLKTPRERR